MQINSPIKNTRVTLLASLGSALEYYDFVVYGMMAPYLSTIFFSAANPLSAVLQSFLVFAVGYFARPLGGTFIGIIGDRLGRKPAFLMSTTLMAASTLLIAFLPAYEGWGVASILLLVCGRIMQGLSFGAELPGAITIVSEFSSKHRRGFSSSLVIASTSIGSLMASTVLAVLSGSLSKEEIINFGWRLPFLAGGVLGLLLLFARKNIEETPVFHTFSAKSTTNKPLTILLNNHKLSLLKGSALTAFMAALIISNLYFPYYIPKFFAYEAKQVYFATTISLIFSALVLPFMGVITDYFHCKNILIRYICALFIILSIPLFALLSAGKMIALIAFLIIIQSFIAIFSACLFPSLINNFSPEIRYTGIALSYNLMWALISTLPMGFTALLNFNPSPLSVPLVLSVIAGLSMLASFGFRGFRKEPTVDNALSNESILDS